ncbi:hypothetical protein VPH35_024750 [Triticum aestivum]
MRAQWWASPAAAATCRPSATAGALDLMQRHGPVPAEVREDEGEREGRRGGRKVEERGEGAAVADGPQQQSGRRVRAASMVVRALPPPSSHHLRHTQPPPSAPLFFAHGNRVRSCQGIILFS